ncbi:unnamed protein product [Ceutorhynchus assimilis]|uniref:Uncharacterized protein n=1 Tax=Ceutorhynchus assimilis TaxID=467358 RepID=A0A9N9MLW6_9CUCU|nr:unnamed protein product [Ceutorhynchus assimilis]
MAKSLRNCRLCLAKIQDTNFTYLDGIIKDMLEIILPELNFTICDSSSICNNCLETLKQSYNFKSTCLEVEDRVQDFVDPKKLNCVDLKEVIKKSKDIKPISLATMIVCRICLSLGEESSNTKLCSYEGDPLQNMVEKCLPEMDLTISVDPSICQTCLEQLEEHFHFIMQCLDTEAKISFYSVKEAIFHNVDLSKITPFYASMEKIQLEESSVVEKPATNGLVKKKQEDIKDIVDHHLFNNGVKEEVSFTVKKDENGEDVIMSRTTVLEEDSDSDVSVACDDDLLILKTEARRRRQSIEAKSAKKKETGCTYKEDPGEDSDVDWEKKRGRLRRCKICKFKTKFASRIKAHMTRNHKVKSDIEPTPPTGPTKEEIKTFKCRLCTFQTLDQTEHNNHKKVHQKEREKQCPHCTMTFVRPDFMRKHLDACYIKKFGPKRSLPVVVENRPQTPKRKLLKKEFVSPNVTMSKPNRRNTISINGKMLKMFKCQLCPYQTRLKSNRERHALTHKKSTEMKVHKCKICQFETIQKENYLAHMQGHEIDSEKVMRCFLCSYQPTSKESLSLHVAKVHKSTG